MGKSMGKAIRVTCVTSITKMVTCITKTMRGEVVWVGSIAMVSIGRDGINSRGSLNSDGCGGSDGGILVGYNGGMYGGNMVNLVVGNRAGNVVGQSLDLVQRLEVSGFGLNKRFLGEDRLGFNDGVRDVVDGGDGSGNNFSNGSGFMDNGGLSNGMGQS